MSERQEIHGNLEYKDCPFCGAHQIRFYDGGAGCCIAYCNYCDASCGYVRVIHKEEVNHNDLSEQTLQRVLDSNWNLRSK